jgi:hypothetical protein
VLSDISTVEKKYSLPPGICRELPAAAGHFLKYATAGAVFPVTAAGAAFSPCLAPCGLGPARIWPAAIGTPSVIASESHMRCLCIASSTEEWMAKAGVALYKCIYLNSVVSMIDNWVK